jgi:class 3 adenylate cyclase/tetratricopeptide (TPR) repeat protein
VTESRSFADARGNGGTGLACPACGSPNSPEARFCGACGTALERECEVCKARWGLAFRFCANCGAPLTPPAPQQPGEVEERKVVSVLFADLIASTELASRLDPEDLRAVLTPFFDAMVDEIRRFGGTVEKFIGDAIVAVFGVPVAHEDDPERAVRTAFAMQRRLAELNRELPSATGLELAMRIGVDTGEVVTVPGSEGEALATGGAMHLAARLQAAAAPGAILVDARTYRDTRDTLAYRPLPAVTVKGVDDPLPAWEATGELPPPSQAAFPSAPLVGREGELDLLQLLLARTIRERRPNLVTVIAPAGVGKSRLAREFLARTEVENPEVDVVRGRCLPYGDGLTYWPLAEILKMGAGILDSDPHDAILEKAWASLERLGLDGGEDGIGTTLLASVGMRAEGQLGVEGEVAKEVTTRSWRRYFEALAGEQPLVVVIEDLHWADRSLLDLIEELALRLAAPILVLCLARPDLLERRGGWGGGLANASTIMLSLLTNEESEALVQSLLGEGKGPDHAIRAILERAEGNPFFTQELVRMMVEDGYLARRDDEWRLERPLPASLPDTVHAVIAARIDLLPPPEKRALQDAAVVGRIFWQGAVERLGLRDAGEILDALRVKGLIVERDRTTIAGEREFIFSHVLVRDVAYATIPRARRVHAHADAGVWLEETTSGRGEEFAEILAHHFRLAGDAARTARYAVLAGERKQRVFAAEEAVSWYDTAWEAARSLGKDADHRLVAEIALARGEALEQLARFPTAQANFKRAVTEARVAGDARLEVQALAAVAHADWRLDRYEEARQVLSKALTRARSVDATDLVAPLLYTSGTVAFGQGEWAQALAFQQEALRTAQAVGDRVAEGRARHGLTETRWGLGPFVDGLAQGLAASELLEAIGFRPLLHENEYVVGWLLWFQGRLDEAQETLDRALAGTREIGDRRNEAAALPPQVMLALSRGEFGRAVRTADEAVRIGSALQSPRIELTCRSIRMEALRELKALERLAEDLVEAKTLSDRVGGRYFRPRLLAFDAFLKANGGDAEAAKALFDDARALAAEALFERITCGRLELLAWEAARDPAALRVAAERLRADAEGESPTYLAWASYGLAGVAAQTEEWAEAADLAEAALSQAHEVGETPVILRAAPLASRAHAHAGRRAEARSRSAEAAAVARRVVASIEDEVLRSLFVERSEIPELLP